MSYESDQMIDRRISDMLNQKMNEPAVSGDFVERMTVRAVGIEQGRAAEKMLADTKRPLSSAENLDLCAKSVVGRLMMTQTPPKGVTTDMMVNQLKDQPRFREVVSGSREGVLYGLRTGEIFRQIAGRKPEAATDARQRAAEAAVSEVKAPGIGQKNRLP